MYGVLSYIGSELLYYFVSTILFSSKRVINVGGGPPASSNNPMPVVQNNGDSRIRVTCGHCNETFVVSLFFNNNSCLYAFFRVIMNLLLDM